MPFVESSVIIRAVQAWTSREKTDAVVEVHETTTSRLHLQDLESTHWLFSANDQRRPLGARPTFFGDLIAKSGALYLFCNK